MSITILGIRHHGVGSATHVLRRLQEIQPDLIMIEGPPEITEVLKYIGHNGLVPPVSIMVYDSNDPKTSVFYPFSSFSPEWVAAEYANKNGIALRAMDMPASVNLQMKLDLIEKEKAEKTEPPTQKNESSEFEADEMYSQIADVIQRVDPISQLAQHSGYENGEKWWDYHFERVHNQTDATAHFEAVHQSMDALREANIDPNHENELREAFMRTYMREAINEMFSNVVVICGAWHGPVLADLDKFEKKDHKAIKSAPKTKIKAISTWIPWTNKRLSMYSGYGAGLSSPGWYQHLWESTDDYDITWLVKVAQTFRSKQMDISSAHVIETSRLAHTLAALRNKSTITLEELNEATLAVMCMGDEIKLNYIQNELTIADRIGSVPDDIPKVPIQEDFEKTIKSLRLPLLPHDKQYDLDLRKDGDLQRSILLHRLELLDIHWGKRTYSRTKGTFKESWVLNWSPEIVVNLIDKAYLGNTIKSAVIAVIEEACEKTNYINVVADFILRIIPAEVFDLLPLLLNKIHDLSSISADIVDLMKSIPSLVDVGRYGNVRNTDTSLIYIVVQNLLTRVFIGLPNACYGLDEAHSEEMFKLISKVNEAIRLINEEKISMEWYLTLESIQNKDGIHPIIRGCVCRLLLDAGQFTEEYADKYMSLALSSGNPPMDVAYWIEGFLGSNGMIVIYDNRLWNLIYKWIESLDEVAFNEQLPYLRRSFSKFEYGERRQIGEKAKKGIADIQQTILDKSLDDFDYQRASHVLPVLNILMKKQGTVVEK
jgi:Family of unknown function (DUF5682)